MKPQMSGSPWDFSSPEVREMCLSPPLREIDLRSQNNLGLLELCTTLCEEGTPGTCPPCVARWALLAGEQARSWSSHPHACHNRYLNIKAFRLPHPVVLVSKTIGHTPSNFLPMLPAFCFGKRHNNLDHVRP